VANTIPLLDTSSASRLSCSGRFFVAVPLTEAHRAVPATVPEYSASSPPYPTHPMSPPQYHMMTMRQAWYSTSQRFIERFDLDLVTLTANLPPWYRNHLTMLVSEQSQASVYLGWCLIYPVAVAVAKSTSLVPIL